MFLILRAWVLVIILMSAGPLSAYESHTKVNDSDSKIKHLNTLLTRSGKDYRVKVRITSRSKDSHSVVYLMATRATDPKGDQLQFRIKGDDTPAREFCLKCLPAGGVSNCGSDSATALPEPEARLPGLILPWEEVLVGACGSWVVEEIPAASKSPQHPQQVYQVRLTNAAFEYSWANTLITMDADSKDPEYFDRVDDQGKLLRRIRVLEIGATGSWRGIRKAIVEMPEGRVLMEIVGFRKGAGKMRRGTRQK